MLQYLFLSHVFPSIKEVAKGNSNGNLMNSPPLSTFLSHSIIHPLGCHTYLLSLVSLYTQFCLSTIHLAVDPGSHPLPVPPLCPSSIYLFITSLIYHLCLSSLLSNLFLTLVYSWVCVCVSECGWASQKMITNCRIICSLCVCVCTRLHSMVHYFVMICEYNDRDDWQPDKDGGWTSVWYD